MNISGLSESLTGYSVPSKQCNLRLETLSYPYKYCLVPIILKGQYSFQEKKKGQLSSFLVRKLSDPLLVKCQHALLATILCRHLKV